MGFTKRVLPEIEELMEIHRLSSSDKEFISKVVGKCDGIYGSVESVTYLNNIYENLRTRDGGQNSH